GRARCRQAPAGGPPTTPSAPRPPRPAPRLSLPGVLRIRGCQCGSADIGKGTFLGILSRRIASNLELFAPRRFRPQQGPSPSPERNNGPARTPFSWLSNGFDRPTPGL